MFKTIFVDKEGLAQQRPSAVNSFVGDALRAFGGAGEGEDITYVYSGTVPIAAIVPLSIVASALAAEASR